MTEQYTPYEQGFIDGLTAYAVNKDGVQWVGSTGRKLKTAIEKMRDTWNFMPECHEVELLEALELFIQDIDRPEINRLFDDSFNVEESYDNAIQIIKNSKG